ncbi:MAG: cytochrome c biogenesis protein CcdA [Planctomycetota bacterium]
MNRLLQSVSTVFTCSLMLFGSVAFAQDAPDLPKLNIIDQLGIPGLGGSSGGEKAEFAAEYRIAEGTRNGRLSVTATMEADWHVYSVTQLPGGPMRSVIKLDSRDQANVTGEFKPDVPPHVKQYEFFDVPVEEHDGRVVWTAPIQLAEGIDPTATELQIKFNGQVCQDEGSCIPIANKSIVAKFAGYYKEQTAVTEFRTETSHLTLRGTIDLTSAQPGSSVTLTLTAEPTETWHVYAYAERDPKLIAKPTLIAITEPSGWPTSAVTASVKPIEYKTGLEEEPLAHFHEQPVTWSIEIAIPADTLPGPHTIAGLIGYQTCTLTDCDKPTAAAFRGTIEVGSAAVADEVSLGFTSANYKEVADRTSQASAEATASDPPVTNSETKLDLDNLHTQSTTAELSTPVVLMMAFAAGFILNFMPCVLPVIGLKVMAFVQQAGDSRARSFMLNVWYSLGLMSVFLILATLSVFLGLGWGEQFSSVTFNVILTSVVFAFALSFLGVWEIPIPGFVGSGKVGDLATKEGASGAFFKGALTTVLATPCSGPLLGPALTWAVSQTPAVAYAGFACVGLGMASPYLLIGAFPELVSFLPKPGAWMDTFKHLMGFVLLGTVIFLLTFVPIPFVVPTVAFMMGMWAAFWWIGRVPLTESLDKKASAWVAATAFAAVIAVVAYGVPLEPLRSKNLLTIMSSRFQRAVDQELSARNVAISNEPRGDSRANGHELPWQPYTQQLLEQLTSQRKTVFVDFTADW